MFFCRAVHGRATVAAVKRLSCSFAICLSMVAAVQLVCAQAAHAQAPAATPPAEPSVTATPPEAAAPAYPPATPPMMAAPAGPILRLHANNPRARLQQMQLRWTDVCMAPCGVPVDPSGLYRVGGGTLRASDPFKLPRPNGEVLVDAEVGSNVKHWVGFGLSIGGIVAAAAGALYLFAGSSASNTTTANGDELDGAFKVFGITYLIVGGVLMAVGLPMWFGNNTSVAVR